MLLSAASTVSSFSAAVTADMFNGIFKEVIALMPKVLSAIISFIAFRKGWAFIKSAVKGA